MVVRLVTTHGERGSALVEFSLLMGVLLPLGFGVSMIGKLSDLNQTVEQASRYAAWEATVYARPRITAQHASRLEERFFESPDLLLSSQHPRGDTEPSENPLWGKSATSTGGVRDLASVSRHATRGVSSQYAFDTAKAQATLVSGKIVAKAGQPLSGFNGNSWGMVADGLLRSTVELAVKPTGMLPVSNVPCGVSEPSSDNTNSSDDSENNMVCLRRAGVILADGWAASGDRQTVSRVRSLVPASTMQSIGKGVGKLLGSVVFPELDPLDRAFGHVDMRVLPRYARP
ncbi:MAG: TadE family protein [Granulosicoccus sp.]